MLDQVGNPEYQFSSDAARMISTTTVPTAMSMLNDSVSIV